jgi:hypothetical protein
LGAGEPVQVERPKEPRSGVPNSRAADEFDDGCRSKRAGMRREPSAREAGDLDTVPRKRRAIDDASVDEALNDEAHRA